MTCAHCRDIPRFFDPKVAAQELKRYRRKGPVKTTRILLDALRAAGVKGRTLLDVGGGIGAIQHELLAAGAAQVVNADAAPAYQEAVREEAERRGTADRIEFYAGDFVELAPALPSADLVTLDRVICCYPDMEKLVGASAERARSLWGAVFPREYLGIRIAFRAINLIQRLRRQAFRVYVHPRAGVERVLRARGLDPIAYRKTLLWQVMVWGRSRAAR